MTCSEFTSNNRPLGAGYDSRNHPRSLTELTSINVSSVIATSGITTSSITPITGNGGDLVINGRIVAQAIIGSGNYFSALGDVQPGISLTPGYIVTVNSTSNLAVSSPSSVLDSLYLRRGGTAETVNNLSPAANTYIYWNGGGNAQTGNIYTQGVNLLNAATPSQVQSILGYATTFAELDDAFDPVAAGTGKVLITNATGITYAASSIFGGGGGGGGASALSSLNDVTITSPSNGNILRWDSATNKWVNLASSLFVASSGGTYPNNFVFGGVSATTISATNYSGISLSGSLRDATITSPVLNQVLYWNGSRWVNGQPIAFYNLVDVDAPTLPINDTSKLQGSVIEWNSSNDKWEAINASGWLTTYQNFIDHGSLSGLGDNDHPQYVLSSTNINLSSYATGLSSTLGAHIASSTVHFTSGSLSGYYAASSWVNTNFVTTSTYTTLTGTTLPATYQPLDPTLSTLSGLPTAANILPYFSSTDGAASALFTAYARTFVSSSDASAARSNLELVGPASSIIYFSAFNKTASATLTPFARTILDDTTASDTRGTIGLSGAANTMIYFSSINGPAQTTITQASLSILNNLYGSDSLIGSDGGGGYYEIPYLDKSVLIGKNGAFPQWLQANTPNDIIYFDGANPSWLAGGGAGTVLAIDNGLGMSWVASSTFAGSGGGTPGGSETNVQYKAGSSFGGDPGFTYTVGTKTVSGTNIKFTNASGTIVSATTVSAGVVHVGGSDGYIKNNNGNLYLSATNGNVLFPLGLSAIGLSAVSAVIPGLTVSGGGAITTTLVSDNIVVNTSFTATSVSATTYNNLPFDYGNSYMVGNSLFY